MYRFYDLFLSRILPRKMFAFYVLSIIFCAISFSAMAFAESGGGDPRDAEAAKCDSPHNVVNKLCNGGKNGGGASWRIYKTAKSQIDIDGVKGKKKDGKPFVILQPETIKGCNKYGWYLRYGYEQIIYKKNPKPSRQLGVGSITGAGSDVDIDEGEFVSNMMYVDSSIKYPMYYNDSGAINIDKKGSNIDYNDLIKKTNGLAPDSGIGLKMKWEDVKSMFEKMIKISDESVRGYTMNDSIKNPTRPGLGWFCFNPELLKDDKDIHSVSSVSVKKGSNIVAKGESGQDGKKEIIYAGAKVGETIYLDFKHYIQVQFDPKVSGNFSSDYTIYNKNGGRDTRSNNFSQDSEWIKSGKYYNFDANKSFNNFNTINITISSESEILICQHIGKFYKKLKQIGSTFSGELADEDNSKICVKIKPQKDTSPALGICFRDGIIDATKDQGNNAIWSYVRNASRGGAFPEPSNNYNDNPNLNSNLRETKVVGGKGGIGSSEIFIFAKPNDQIQFRHVFCFGAQAVKSLPQDKAKSGITDRAHYTEESTFNLSGTKIYGDSLKGSGVIGFKSAENSDDITVTRAKEPSASSAWGRAYDDGNPERQSTIQAVDTGEIISQEVSIGSNYRAWVGGSAERTFRWDKLIGHDTFFTDRFMEPRHSRPTACGCNATDDRYSVLPSITYGEKGEMGDQGLKFEKCRGSGRDCTKFCDPISRPGEKPVIYPRDCDSRGECRFKEFEEDKAAAYKFFPLNTEDGRGYYTKSEVKVPYNFDTRLESAPRFEGAGTVNGSGIVFAGELVNGIKADIKIVPRINRVVADEKEYATNTPEIQIKTIAFTIDSNIAKDAFGIDSIKKIIQGESLDARSALIDINYKKILDINSGKQAFNSSANENGSEEEINLSNLVVPDEEVGTKLCVMTAIYPADSNNTMVIDASKKVYINSNIKYRHSDAVVYGYLSISSLPQILIFAKDIYISSKVTNIDAWLIAENIYSCAEAHDGDSIKDSISAAINDDAASGDSACGKQLRINGPVFVGSQVNRGKLHLLRHAGAYPGNKATGGDRGNFTDPVLNADGSVTPAEIFNLRFDAYLWAYSQAERLTQAFVTYSRELPPRY